ncbi:unnamed protein product [Camellia sinensis]
MNPFWHFFFFFALQACQIASCFCLQDYDSLLSGTQPTVQSKLVNFQKDLVSLQQ